MGLRSLFSATMVAGLLLIGSVSPASADSPPVTTPGAPTGTRSAPAGGASPEAAKAAAPSCSYQRFCVSKDTYFNGPTYRFTGPNSNWALVSYANLYNEDLAELADRPALRAQDGRVGGPFHGADGRIVLGEQFSGRRRHRARVGDGLGSDALISRGDRYR